MKFPFAIKAIAGLSTMFMASACGYGSFFTPPPIVYRNWGIVTPPDERRSPYPPPMIPRQSVTVYPDRNLAPPEDEEPTPAHEPHEPPPVQTYGKPEPGTGQPVPLLRRTPGPSS